MLKQKPTMKTKLAVLVRGVLALALFVVEAGAVVR